MNTKALFFGAALVLSALSAQATAQANPDYNCSLLVASSAGEQEVPLTRTANADGSVEFTTRGAGSVTFVRALIDQPLNTVSLFMMINRTGHTSSADGQSTRVSLAVIDAQSGNATQLTCRKIL